MSVVQPQTPQRLPLGLTRRREHLGTQVPRQLDRRHTDTTRTGVDQHPLPRLDRGQVTEGVQGGEEDQRHRGRVLVAPLLGHAGHVPLVDEDGVGEAAGDHAGHAVADGDPGDVRADGRDEADRLRAEQSGLAGVHAERVQHVTEVQARGPHLDPDGAALRLVQCLGCGDEGETVDAAGDGGVQAPRQPRDRQQARAGGQPGQAGHQDGLVAYGELRVAGRQQGRKLRQEFTGGRGGARVEVEEGEAAGVLGLGAADESVHRGGGEIAHAGVGPGGDGAPGDEHETSGGGRGRLQPLLDQCQGARGGRVDGRGGVVLDALQRDEDQVGGGRDGGGVGEGGERAGPGAVGTEGDGAHGGGAALGCGHPLQAQEPVLLTAVQGGGAQRRRGAQDEGVGGEHRGALDVHGGDGDGVLTDPGDPHPHHGGAARVQRDAGPGERYELLAVTEAGEADGLDGRVEQRGVHPVVLGVVHLGRQRDLDEGLVVAGPDGAQALEDRAVLGARVEALEVGGDGAAGRPDGGVEAGDALATGQQAGGVLGPALLGVVDGLGVDGDAAGAIGVGRADVDLDDGRRVLGEDEGLGEGEVLDAVAADLVTGADGEFEEAGAGEGHHPADRVVQQPRVGLRGEASGEEDPVAAGQRHGGAEQRVFGGDQARGADVPGGGHQDGPVALVLPAVGGQFGAAGAGALEAGGPVDVDAGDVEPGQRGEQGALLGAVLAQDGDGDDVGPVEALLGEGGEDAVGAQFDEGVGAGACQGADAVGEADRGADVVHPVLGVAQQAVVGEGAGDVGDDRQDRLVVGEALGDAAELREHRLHQRRVEGVADRQALRLAALGGELGGQCEDLGLLARQGDGVGAVDGGEGDALGQARGGLGLGGLDGDHGAARGQFLHEAGAGGDQRAGVLQREHTGDVGGGDLADGVPGHEVRDHAPGLDEAVEGDLHGEERGLGVAGGVEEGRLGGAAPGEHHLPQRAVQARVEQGGDLVQCLREHREAGVQFAAHLGALGALAGEQDGEGAFGDAAAGRLGGDAVEAGEQDGAVLEEGAPGGQGVADVEGRGVGESGDGLDLRVQGRLGAGVHGPRHDGRDGLGLRRGLRLGGGSGLLDHDVGVGAADAEGGDAGAARAAGLGPLDGLGEQPDGPGVPVDVARGVVGVEGARDDAVPHRHDHLDDAGDSRGGLRVADVRLDGAEQQRPVLGAALAVGGEQGLGLDGVAERGAGPVALDRVDVGGGESGGGQRLLDDALLGGAVGGGEAVGGAVLVDGGAAQHGEDRVAVAAGVGEPLQEEDTDPLRPAGAVGLVGERLAAAVTGQAAGAAELHQRAGGGHDVDAAGEGEAALPRAQGVGGGVEGDEGGGAGGVDGDRRPLQAQGVGEAAGGGAGGDAGADVAGRVGEGAHQEVRVVLAVGADEDAGAAAAQAARVDAGALHGLPGGLQQQPLLGVHGDGFARGDAEEGGVEVGDPVEEAAPLADGVATGVDPGVPQRVQVPAPVGGEAADGVGAGGDEVPQVLGGGDSPGVAAAHRDDGDGLRGGGREVAVLPAQAFGLLERGPESFDNFFAGRGHDGSVSPALRQGYR